MILLAEFMNKKKAIFCNKNISWKKWNSFNKSQTNVWKKSLFSYSFYFR
jgi:hypothetical protein